MYIKEINRIRTKQNKRCTLIAQQLTIVERKTKFKFLVLMYNAMDRYPI
jgi:hypothetical protein